MEQNPVQQKNLKQKQNPSVIDWLLIYTGAIILMNLLIRTQMYPSYWIASLLLGGETEVNLMLVHELLQCTLLVGGVLLFLRLRGNTMQSIGWRQPQNEQDYVRGIVFGILTCSLMLMLSGLLMRVFPQWAETQNVVSTATQIHTRWDLIAMFISVGILAPLCEEVLFRGYLYHAVHVKFGKAASVIFTSFLFAAVHGQWFQLLPLFLAGVCLNCFYLRTNSLIATVLMHSAWNTFSLFLIVYMNIVI